MTVHQGIINFVRVIGFVPRVLIPAFLIVATMFCGRAMGLAIYDAYFLVPDEKKVVRVVGKDVQEAKKILKAMGLSIDVSEMRVSSKVPKNQVMEQYPPPFREVREGSTVSVVVSTGPDTVAVPKVIDKNLRDAQVDLHNAKLAVGKVTRVARHKNDPEMVLEQNPKAGKSVKKGTKIELVVNIGNVARVKVPSFANQTIERVRDAAAWHNLKMGTVQWVVHEGIGTGMVINQDPSAESEVPPGTEVNFRVSLGTANNNQDVRQRLVQVRAQDVVGPQQIRVMVSDTSGGYTAYEGTHYQGEIVNLYVTSMGPGEYEVFVNGSLVARSKI